jgi:uncharacterized protein (DUF924 family)
MDEQELTRAILDYWFSSLDDSSELDRTKEPFGTCFARWYGKRDDIDREIRERFEGALTDVARAGAEWEARVQRFREVRKGLLALTILLDQFPRNMYRNTPAMYAHDPLALTVALAAAGDASADELSLVERMFLYVPLMHVENLTLQELMLVRFRELAELSATRSPKNVGFFGYALDYAARHVEVIRRFGRFPHRNSILGRASTDEELEFLKRDDSSF